MAPYALHQDSHLKWTLLPQLLLLPRPRKLCQSNGRLTRNENTIAVIQALPPEHLLELEASEHYNTRDLTAQRFDNYMFS